MHIFQLACGVNQRYATMDGFTMFLIAGKTVKVYS